MTRPNSLPRHLRTKHGQAEYHYHCAVRGCSFWNLRKDKVQKHCREVEGQAQGQEQTIQVNSELALLFGKCEVANCDWLATNTQAS